MVRPRDRRGERGSVFVEALIAVAIVALVLGGLFEVVGENAARRRALEARRTAFLIAQSALAAAGADAPLAPGRSDGRQGAFVWRTEIEPTAEGESPAGRLLRISVAVRSEVGGGELARLSTLRIAPPPRDPFADRSATQ